MLWKWKQPRLFSASSQSIDVASTHPDPGVRAGASNGTRDWSTRTMNYPLLPIDAAEYAWQLSCCVVTLLFAVFSWMIGPR